jgi:hypothetical protein
MNGIPRVPASPRGRFDAPTVIGAGCAQILLPGKGKRPTIALSRRASGECRFNSPGTSPPPQTPTPFASETEGEQSELTGLYRVNG